MLLPCPKTHQVGHLVDLLLGGNICQVLVQRLHSRRGAVSMLARGQQAGDQSSHASPPLPNVGEGLAAGAVLVKHVPMMGMEVQQTPDMWSRR